MKPAAGISSSSSRNGYEIVIYIGVQRGGGRPFLNILLRISQKDSNIRPPSVSPSPLFRFSVRPLLYNIIPFLHILKAAALL